MVCGELIGLMLYQSAFSQTDPLEESWRWVQFTTSSGLPSEIILDIHDAPDGTPWAYTGDGFAWYDGYLWHSINTLPARAGKNSVAGFYKDQLVLNTEGRAAFVTRSSVKHDTMEASWCFSNDTLIYRSKGEYFLLSGNRTEHLHWSWLKERILTEGFRKCERSHFLIQTRNTLHAWNGKKHRALIKTPRSDLTVVSASINSNGSGLAFVKWPISHQGIWEWDSNGKSKRVQYAAAQHALHTAIDENGDAAVLYESNLLRVRRKGEWITITQLPKEIRDVSMIRFRKTGDLWVATYHGLFLCKLSRSYWDSFTWEGHDLRNRINNVLRASDGTVWLATSGGLIRRTHDGSLETIRSIRGRTIRIVTGLVEDREKNIWLSSGSDFTGVYRWDGRSWTHLPVRYQGESIWVHDLYCDALGRIWFLCLSQDQGKTDSTIPGVFLYDRGTLTPWKESKGLPFQRVYAMAEGSDGTLWFGTYDGLARWGDHSWTYWLKTAGLKYIPVTTLAVDTLNRVWFGMQRREKGLGVIDGSDTVRYFTTNDGLPSDYVWDVQCDGRNRIWVTTNDGLACSIKGKWLSFDERSGLHETQLVPVHAEDSLVTVGTASAGFAELNIQSVEEDCPAIILSKPLVEEDRVNVSWKVYALWGSIAPDRILTRFRLNETMWSAWTTQRSLALEDVQPGTYSLQIQAKGLFGHYDDTGATVMFIVQPPLFLRWYFYIPATVTAVIIIGLTFLLQSRRRVYIQELSERESRYRVITELMSDYAYLVRVHNNGEMQLTWMTESFTRLTGYSFPEAQSPEFLKQYVHRDDLQSALENQQQLLAGKRLHSEHRIVTKSQEIRWIEHRAIPVKQTNGHRVEYIYGVVHDITERKETEQRMRSLAGDLVRTEERERRRMAVFLHDVIGQTLTLSYLTLHRWQKKEHRDDDPVLDDIRTMLDQVLKDTHTLTFDLCPPIIHELSLGEALEWLVERLQNQHGVIISTAIDPRTFGLSSELHTLLFQAVRELLVNSIKHADARSIRLSLHRSGNCGVITVSDDGIGFDPDKLSLQSKDGSGFGLFSIRVRLSDFGAKLDIDSKQGDGAQVRITFDLTEKSTGDISTTTRTRLP